MTEQAVKFEIDEPIPQYVIERLQSLKHPNKDRKRILKRGVEAKYLDRSIDEFCEGADGKFSLSLLSFIEWSGLDMDPPKAKKVSRRECELMCEFKGYQVLFNPADSSWGIVHEDANTAIVVNEKFANQFIGILKSKQKLFRN